MGFGGSSGGGASTVSGLNDVALNNPANSEILTFDTTSQKWKNASGGTATSEVMIWKYTSGAYPALPTTKPTGIKYVLALGPVQPTNIPSWMGTGSTQVIGKYEYTELT